MTDRNEQHTGQTSSPDAARPVQPGFDPELDPPHDILWPAAPLLPLVISSPHSGNIYPQRFLSASRLDPMTLRRTEDAHVDALLGPAATLGIPMLLARFPRAYLDVNREPYELDPRMFDGRLPSWVNSRSMRVAGGLGTIARVVGESQEIYARKLAVDEGLGRIEALYRPYHAAMRSLLESTLEQFGQALLLDCHSMPSSSIPQELHQGGRSIDMVLGDRYGTSAGLGIVDLMERRLRELGYSVRRNKPYAGGFITEYYGNPSSNCHAVQIEVNRAIYMNEKTLERLPRFEQLAADLAGVIGEIGRMMDRGGGQQLAAE
jgi:N-formylglutamate amidohydrolase